jgi:hypothetical protein
LYDDEPDPYVNTATPQNKWVQTASRLTI